MPFMLGSFTSGMFSAAKDAFSIAHEWEQLKQERMQTEREQKFMAAGNAAQAEMDRQQAEAAAGNSPNEGKAVGAPSRSTGPIGDDPLLKGFPTPRVAIGDRTSPNEGKNGALGAVADRTSPNEGRGMSIDTPPAPSTPSAETDPNAPPSFSGMGKVIGDALGPPARALKRSAIQTEENDNAFGQGGAAAPTIGGIGQTLAPAGAAVEGAAVGPEESDSPFTPGPRTAPPQYLPAAPTTPAPQQAVPPRISGLPIPGLPNLASPQGGLGASILHALGSL